MLVVAGFLAHGQIQRHGAADLHVILAPAVGHLGQGVGVHGGLHLGIHLFRAADAGGIDGRIAQRLQHGGGIFQNFGLLLQIGEGVHAAVGENDHFAQGGDLVEHAVGGEMGGAQAALLVEHSPHQVGCAQNALHEEVGFALGAQSHSLGGAVRVGIGGDDLIGYRVFADVLQHPADLVSVTHQNGGGNALAAGGHHGLDDRLIVRRSYGDHAALTALGGLHNALDGIDHKTAS